MRDYHERLRAPISWWLISLMCVLILGTELFAGFSLTIGLITYVVLALICAAFLLHWGGAVVQVRNRELRAARVRVPVDLTGEVRALDEIQTRAMRGPLADPTAYMLIRPYLKKAVYVELSEAHAKWPYLLICTRHPAELADAIAKSRTEPATHG
jgi:Protein of unknown function (DUF3093)